MPETPDSPAQKAAIGFAREAAALFDRHLGARLAGVYLIGSLAHGGFCARYSDIDMALTVEEPLGADEPDALRRAAAAQAPALAAKLSIFWTDRDFTAGRFPPLDRVDLIDHGIALMERRRLLPPRPTLAEIRTYLAGAPFESWSRDAMRLATADALNPDDRKRFLRALLYPARFIYSWETGSITSNDAAVSFLQHHKPAGLDLDIIAGALECRNDGSDPDPLFAERAKLRGLVDACRQLTIASGRASP